MSKDQPEKKEDAEQAEVTLNEEPSTKDALSTQKSKLPLPRRFYVAMSDLLQFLYPKHVLHPHPTLRLFLFAEYGPLYGHHSFAHCLCSECKVKCKGIRKENESAKQLFYGKVLIGTAALETNDESLDWLCSECRSHCCSVRHLKSGHKNMHIVTDSEITKMEQEMARKDIISCFVTKKEELSNPLSMKDEEELFQRLPLRVKRVPKLSKQEMVGLFSKLPAYKLYKSGCIENEEEEEEEPEDVLSFYDISRVVRRVRESRKKDIFRRSVTSEDPIKNGPKHRTKAIKTKALRYTSNTKKHRLADCELSNVLTNLLHTFVHEISSLDTASNNDVTQNVRLLRYLEKDNDTNWDSLCCLRGSNPSTNNRQ